MQKHILALLFLCTGLGLAQCQNKKTASVETRPATPHAPAEAPATAGDAPELATTTSTSPTPSNATPQPAPSPAPPATPSPEPAPKDTNWIDLEKLEPSIMMDIRYATNNNFTKSQIYDCPKCLLRPDVAQAVVRAHKELQKQGLGLKMHDCYRPGPYQQRLWDKVPDENYVAHPSKGSMHSRGVAVDLTLVDAQGNELDMGTPYDFFGPEAHTAYTNLPEKVLENRRRLKKALEDQGFNAIKYEWWHYNYRQKEFPLSNYVWPCK